MSLTDKQKAARKGLVTGSRIAKIAGVSPYGGPLAAYREIVEGYEQPETPEMLRGTMLEPAVLSWFAADQGAKLMRIDEIVRHPVLPFLGATPDAIATVSGESGVVEAKTAGWRMADQWGEAGTDQIPTHYTPQVQVEMGVTGLKVAWVPVLIAGEDFRVYRVEFDAELFGMLAEMARKFFKDHVEPQKPPPLDASPEAAEWLAKRFSKPEKKVIPAPPEAEQWVKQYRAAAAEADAASEKRDLAKNHLKQIIGNADAMAGDGWRISWALTKGRKSTDWAAVAAEAGVSDALIAKHTTAKAAYRTFRPNWKDSNNDD